MEYVASPAVQDATVMVLHAPQPLWIFPLLCLLGVGLHMLFLWKKRALWLCLGTFCILLAAVLDKDITLFAGQSMATGGLYYLHRKAPDDD